MTPPGGWLARLTVSTLAEILALRKIIVNLLYSERTGDPLDQGRMRELIEAADAEKLAKAVERLRGDSSNGNES